MPDSAAIFDINETVLDLSALDSLFAAWFGDAAARSEWFAQTLHFALTLAATRHYQSFAEIGVAALSAVAARRGVELPPDVATQLRQVMVRLPAHPEAAAALHILRAGGFRTAALSNNPLAMLREQLAFAGLAPLFDQIMSVEEAGAIRAGLRGAFVARPGQLPDPFAPPEIIGADLVAVANTLRDVGS